MERTVAALLPEDETAEEIALLQSRQWWAIPGGVVAFLFVVTLLGTTGLADILAAAIGGGALGAVMAVATQSYLVARTDRRVVMFRSSKWQASAVEIVGEFPLGTSIKRRRSVLNDTYELDERKLIGSRVFRSRIEEIFSIAD
jgi:hypothetical protein